jgi:hypothetical protein
MGTRLSPERKKYSGNVHLVINEIADTIEAIISPFSH